MKEKLKEMYRKVRNFKWTKENVLAVLKTARDHTVAFIKKYGNIQTWKDSMIPEHPEYNERVKRFFVMFLGAVFGLIFVIVLIFLAIGSIQAPRVRMPALVGMDVLDAVRLVQSEQLQPNFETRFNEDTERYAVTGQYPSPGLNIRVGRRVTLIVSMGKDIYVVPALSGMSKDEALALLVQEKIPYQTQFVPAGESPIDTVIAQNFPAGKKIPRKENLILTITENILAGQYKLEDFTRQSLEFAANRLLNNGVTLTIIGTNISSPADDGMVFAQNTPPNTTLSSGSSVNLTVGVYARDQGERNKLKWNYIRYRFPAIVESGQQITTNESGEAQVTATEAAAAAKFYRIELNDELGRKSVVYERTGGEGSVVIRAFKSFGKSKITISADGVELETRIYE